MTPCIDCTLLTDNVTTVDGRAVARCGACGTEEVEPAAEVPLIPVPETAHFRTEPPGAIHRGDRWTLHHADVLEALRGMEDNSFDALLSDVPYGLGSREPTADELAAYILGTESLDTGGDFMGKQWEIPSVAFWREALRVLKPGAPILAFSGSRTHDLVTIGIRAAGFEIRDCLMWLYAKGFPKSQNIGLAIDKAAGATRQVVGTRILTGNAAVSLKDKGGTYGVQVGTVRAKDVNVTAPATDLAQAWDGYGTALKPAHEPIVLARKPLDGTMVENVARWGVGGLAIDACRIGASAEDVARAAVPQPELAVKDGVTNYGTGTGRNGEIFDMSAGRWPANLALSHKTELWYCLIDDLSPELVDAIHAYYGVDEAVRALRGRDLRDAVPSGEAKVLQPGVRWVEPRRSSEDRMVDAGMSLLPPTVSDANSLGSERQKEILLEEVPFQGNPSSWTSRHASQRGESPEDAGCGDGQVPARELVAVERRPRADRAGVCARDDRYAARASEEPGRHDGDLRGEVRQVHSGAPDRCGHETQSSAASQRGGPPPERSQGRQPSGEPERRVAPRTHDQTQRDGERDRSPAGESISPRAREPHLEVSAESIPAGWERHFTLAAVGGCRPTGATRTIRNGTAVKHNGVVSGTGASFGIAKPVGTPDAGYGEQVIDVWDCAPDCPIRLLDEHSGERSYADCGGASRFFFCSKVSTAEREYGCEGLPMRSAGECTQRADHAEGDEERRAAGINSPRAGAGRIGGARNHHPTLKPLSLTTWLARLILPPRPGVLLVPYAGTASEMIGALRAGWDEVVGIERDAEYIPIAVARLTRWAGVPAEMDEADAVKSANAAAKQAAGSLSLFEK